MVGGTVMATKSDLETQLAQMQATIELDKATLVNAQASLSQKQTSQSQAESILAQAQAQVLAQEEAIMEVQAQLQAHLAAASGLQAQLDALPPDTLEKTINFCLPFLKGKVAPGSPPKLLQTYVSDDGQREVMVWENRKPVVFRQMADDVLCMTIEDDAGSFMYAVMCADDAFMEFPGATLLVEQQINYHLHGRCINAWYIVPGGDGDLIETRVLSEWINPFRSQGVAIFQTDQYWNVRAYAAKTKGFANKIEPGLYHDHGFEGSPYRASSRAIPTTPLNKDGTRQYHSYDNGAIDEFQKMHPVQFYFRHNGTEIDRIRVVENGFTKVDYTVHLPYSRLLVMPAMGSYHLQNKLEDLRNQEAAGNGHETGYFNLGMKDRRRFGPLKLKVIEAMP